MDIIDECRQYLWDFQNWYYEHKDLGSLSLAMHQAGLNYYIRKLQALGFEFAPLYCADEDLSWLQ